MGMFVRIASRGRLWRLGPGGAGLGYPRAAAGDMRARASRGTNSDGRAQKIRSESATMTRHPFEATTLSTAEYGTSPN